MYRWFPTKTLLLAAITAYEVEQFDAGLQALADRPEVAEIYRLLAARILATRK